MNEDTGEAGEASTLHNHCEKCYKVQCTVRSNPPESCSIMECTLHCGAKFHSCKLQEHTLICSKEKVKCINAENGCPVELPRCSMAKHLVVCPASVIHCTMEWNRWPVYSRERNARVPFSSTNYHAKYGQLDVALALRDQRMLNAAMKAPRSTRRALRNKLTQRFPAVPLAVKRSSFEADSSLSPTSGDASRGQSDDEIDTDAPWEVCKKPPGLASSVCSELFKATKRTTDSLSAALNLITDAQNPKRLSDISENGELKTSGSPETSDQIESGAQGSSKNLGAASDKSEELGAREKEMIIDDKGIEVNNANVHMTEDNVQAMAMPKALNLPQPPPLLLEELLALDLNLESITRYQAKAKSMYTFLCAQCFRRDEYPWHFQNVHLDIHGGLNGWLEQRCPLAHYGCTYSFRRFYPGHKGDTVVYSPLLESFGVKPYVHPKLSEPPSKENSGHDENIYNNFKNNRELAAKQKELTPEIFTSKDYNFAVHVNGTLHSNLNTANTLTEDAHKRGTSPPKDSDWLSILPFEVLQHIARFLDGYSLCNLAVTSKLLRDVCCSLLTERGIVVQEWEKDAVSKKWVLSYQRWFFSTSFSPVHKWGIEDVPHISEHLKECPVYKPTAKQEPFKLHGTSPSMHENPAFWRPLKAMYPKYDFQWSPTFIECLKEAESELLEKLNNKENSKDEKFECNHVNGDNGVFSDF